MEGSSSNQSHCCPSPPAFTKILTQSHIRYRLDIPTGLCRSINILPFDHNDQAATSWRRRKVEIQVRYGGEPHLRTLRCVLRRGRYPKPVVAKGWSRLVREKQLRVGDRLSFYVDHEGGPARRYRIEVHRRRVIKLFGVAIATLDPIP